MSVLRLILKVLLLPVMLALFLLRVIVNVGIHLSSVFMGLLMLVSLICLVFTACQHQWHQTFVCAMIEVGIFVVLFGAGFVEALLQIAGESIGSFMRS